MRVRIFAQAIWLIAGVLYAQTGTSAQPEAAHVAPSAAIDLTSAQAISPNELRHAKGGILEQPSAERVQKFRAAARRALERYSQQLQLRIPRTQSRVSSKAIPMVGAAARPASPSDPVFSWKTIIVFNTNEDQGQCGSCFIFAGVGALEESWAKQHPNQNIMASQQLVLNCAGNCAGGLLSTVVEFLTNKGTVQFSTDPYTGVPAGCTFNPPLPYQTIAGDYVAPDGRVPTDTDLKTAILKYGPIPAFIYAGGKFDTWWNVKEPAVITDDSSGADNGHIILITGWNDNPDVNAWEIKNSWGSTWGDNGFAYVRKGIRDLGDNAMWVVALP